MKSLHLSPYSDQEIWENIDNLLTDALEMSSNYWYQIENALPEGSEGSYYVVKLQNAMKKGHIAIFSDVEEQDGVKIGELSHERLEKSIVDDVTARYIRDSIEGRADGETADCYLQWVVLGAIVYG